MRLTDQELAASIDTIRGYPRANLDASVQGSYLYVTMNGHPLCRLEPAANGLWHFAIFLWSSERYSKTAFGFDPPPLPLLDHLDFAVNMMS
jgi:hypothetical protein